MDTITAQQLEILLKLGTNAALLLISLLLGIGRVKIYGLEKEGPQNLLLNQNKENINDMTDKKKYKPIVDPNSFAFRNTTVGMFHDKINAPKKYPVMSPSKEYVGEGPFGSMFKRKKKK